MKSVDATLFVHALKESRGIDTISVLGIHKNRQLGIHKNSESMLWIIDKSNP